eukprot:7161188-Prymnesium_polylepis.1
MHRTAAPTVTHARPKRRTMHCCAPPRTAAPRPERTGLTRSSASPLHNMRAERGRTAGVRPPLQRAPPRAPDLSAQRVGTGQRVEG